jgi:hypothetical protein
MNKDTQAIYTAWHLGLPQMDSFSSIYSKGTQIYYRN